MIVSDSAYWFNVKLVLGRTQGHISTERRQKVYMVLFGSGFSVDPFRFISSQKDGCLTVLWLRAYWWVFSLIFCMSFCSVLDRDLLTGRAGPCLSVVRDFGHDVWLCTFTK